MKAVILCGGFGTRIRDVAEDVPKPMIQIGGLPILWHIMKYYATFGHEKFVLCLGYKSSVIKQFFLNYEAYKSDVTLRLGASSSPVIHDEHPESGWEITLAETGAEAMTGARVAKIKRYVADDEHFLLTYGDGVGNVDLEALVAFHRSHGRVLTVTGVHPPGRFGEISCEADGTVTGFNEKPQISTGRISAGFFVCRRDIFDYLPAGDGLVFEKGPMNALVSARQLMVFEHNGFWHPMDTYRDYVYLNDVYGKGEAPWVRW